MKKVLFFLVCLFTMQIANAQVNDIYLRNGVILSDNQWHFDDYSVIEANNGVYLVITPNNHYYSQLLPFNRDYFEYAYGVNVLAYKPYVYGGVLGWYVQGYYNNYFYNPELNRCFALTYVPIFYDFYYSVYRLTHLNLRHWHWRKEGSYYHLWYPRHHQHPPRSGHKVNPVHKNPPPRNGHQTRPPQGNPPRNGQQVRPPQGNPPRNGQEARPPQGNPPRNGQQVRPPQGNPPRNGQQVRPSQSAPSRSGGPSGSGQRSSSRSSQGGNHSGPPRRTR